MKLPGIYEHDPSNVGTEPDQTSIATRQEFQWWDWENLQLSVVAAACAGAMVVQRLLDPSTLRPTPGEEAHAPHCVDGQEPEAGWPLRSRVEPNTTGQRGVGWRMGNQ